MVKKALSDKEKMMAYLFSKDPDVVKYSTKKIGEIFNVSQSTAWNAVKEVATARKIYDLETELSETKKQLLQYKENEEKPALLNIAERNIVVRIPDHND